MYIYIKNNELMQKIYDCKDHCVVLLSWQVAEWNPLLE
jgi:hypothetical protein